MGLPHLVYPPSFPYLKETHTRVQRVTSRRVSLTPFPCHEHLAAISALEYEINSPELPHNANIDLQEFSSCQIATPFLFAFASVFWYCTKLPSASRVTPPRYHTESGNATPGMAVPKPYLVTIVPYLIIVFDGGKLVMWTN